MFGRFMFHAGQKMPTLRAVAIIIFTLPILILIYATTVDPLSVTRAIDPVAPFDNTTSYLPVISKALLFDEPEMVTHVALPDAKCPNALGFNAVSGYTYIVNNFSSNVSVFNGTAFLGNVTTGVWPTGIASDPNSARVYVTNLHSQVAVLDGSSVVGHIPDHYEPYGVTFNPVNGYAYVSDLDSTVQIVNGTSLLTNLRIQDPETGKGAGWLRPILTDVKTGLIYVASWDYGRMYVISGTQVVESYRLGWGPLNMAIDAERGYIYTAHSDPNAAYPHNLSVFSINTKTVTFVSTAVRSRDVAVDPISGYAYASNPDDNTVTVLDGPQVIATLPTGEQPWGAGVNPNSGLAFITNRSGGSVTILNDGAFVKTLPLPGLQPFAVGVDTNKNFVYIANRGDEYGLFECRDASVTILQ